ncbi:MAG: GTPase ObgE [Thermoanaerobaculia bacterium]|nr:GTPase ObgE [Thermoanaerobaculia bacterium]
MAFIDEATFDAVGGDGGHGCVAFRREKYVSKGGPNGGDGGHGGSVMLVGSSAMNTLYQFRHRPRMAAERGRHGLGSNKTGRSGKDMEVEVPLGTVIYDDTSGELIGEVLDEGQEMVVAEGGRGGRGNARFATPTRRAPRFAEEGRAGVERTLRLELKLLADVGLVGFPNAGKSTLISTVSAARPKIADYPFTTLVPNLGVVAGGVLQEPFVIADLPGLIEGAADGQGLGHQFLRHVERCRVLVHLVDLSGGDAAYAAPADDGGVTIEVGDAAEELGAIEKELKEFDPSLLERDRIVVGSKSDAGLDWRRESLRDAAAKRGLDYVEVSSATRKGLDELILALRQRLDEPETGETVRVGRE